MPFPTLISALLFSRLVSANLEATSVTLQCTDSPLIQTHTRMDLDTSRRIQLDLEAEQDHLVHLQAAQTSSQIWSSRVSWSAETVGELKISSIPANSFKDSGKECYAVIKIRSSVPTKAILQVEPSYYGMPYPATYLLAAVMASVVVVNVALWSLISPSLILSKPKKA